jgi:hypothetical protein
MPALDPAAVVARAGIQVLGGGLAAIFVAVIKVLPAAEAVVAARLLRPLLTVAAPAVAA